MIDWAQLTTDQGYDNTAIMLTRIYRKNRTVPRAAAKLGISKVAMIEKMKNLLVARQTQGPVDLPSLKRILAMGDISDLGCTQIGRKMNLSKQRIFQICNRYNIEYRKRGM